MFYEKRYIPIKCAIIDNEIIPFWKLTYTKINGSEGYYKDGENKSFSKIFENDLKDFLWDAKNKEIYKGIPKEIYPEKTEFSLNEIILVETNIYNSYKQDKIIDIVYETHDSIIKKFHDFEEYDESFFSKEELSKMKPEDLYEIKLWRPYYILQSGLKIKYDFNLKHFIN